MDVAEPSDGLDRGASTRLRIGAVVLAAGESTRMGPQNKLICDVDGAPMISKVVDAFLRAPVSPVVVVTGHEAQLVREGLRGRNVTMVHNPDYGDGMSTSIRAGLGALPADLDGVIVGLGDMPWVRPQHIDALIEGFGSGASICVPVYNGRRGNPVLWGEQHLDGLKNLEGDIGGRSLLLRHSAEVRRVEIDDAGVVRDVNTPDALARAGG